MSQMNVHSYAGSRRAELRTLATSKGKRLWQSESGPLNVTLADDTEAALFMAGRIITDLRDLQPEAWIDWQVGDPSRNWASFALNDSRQTFTPSSASTCTPASAATSARARRSSTSTTPTWSRRSAPTARTLALVVRNGDTAASKGFTFDLTALPSVGAAPRCAARRATENLVVADRAFRSQDWSFVATVTPRPRSRRSS